MTHTLQVAMLQTDAGLFSLHGNQVLQTQLKPLFDQLQRIFKWFYVCSQKGSAVRLWISCSNCLICCFGKKKKSFTNRRTQRCWFWPQSVTEWIYEKMLKEWKFHQLFPGSSVCPPILHHGGGGWDQDRPANWTAGTCWVSCYCCTYRGSGVIFPTLVSAADSSDLESKQKLNVIQSTSTPPAPHDKSLFRVLSSFWLQWMWLNVFSAESSS